MEYMGAGKVPEDLDQQHSELARLGRDSKGLVIPFAAIDPRRPNVGSMLKKLVEVDGFKGVKIYPPLGYQPNAEELMKDVYPYCEEKGIPVMTHCSTGGVRHKDMSKETTTGFADPTNYLSIMDKFPNLKICLGHFGGRDEWEKHRTEPWLPGESTSDKSWLGKITDVMKTGKYPNLFADISYTIFSFEENVALLRVLMSNDKIASQVLFGSDFYMVEKSKMAERDLAIRLRADLTEGVFWKIANENPKRYLGL